MDDIILVALVILLAVVFIGYVALCERIAG